MLRRLAVSLLCVAMLVAGMVTASCASAGCPMPQMKMDCCQGPPAGISAASCCEKPPQLSRLAAPATAERAAKFQPQLAFASIVPIVVSTAATAHRVAITRIDARAAPPGSTLVAQHTSLLL